jgi:hypothetical protein
MVGPQEYILCRFFFFSCRFLTHGVSAFSGTVWKFPQKLIISSSLCQNNIAIMLITKLGEEMK